MDRTRDRDRAALPEPMRRDVRLLGGILGEIIRDSSGPELLADVECLRRAVIEARRREAEHPLAATRAATRSRAGRILEPRTGRTGGPGLHRLLSPGQPGRGAPAHPQPAGTRYRHHPVRESLAAAVAEISRDAGPEHLHELLGSLRVHLVLTAHPTEARRRAVVDALRRISGLLDTWTTRARRRRPLRGAAGLHEQIDLLWRTSQLRVKAMDPIDEVRTVMTAFDETLFRIVPRSTGSWTGPWSSAAVPAYSGAGLPAVRQLGGC